MWEENTYMSEYYRVESSYDIGIGINNNVQTISQFRNDDFPSPSNILQELGLFQTTADSDYNVQDSSTITNGNFANQSNVMEESGSFHSTTASNYYNLQIPSGNFANQSSLMQESGGFQPAVADEDYNFQSNLNGQNVNFTNLSSLMQESGSFQSTIADDGYNFQTKSNIPYANFANRSGVIQESGSFQSTCYKENLNKYEPLNLSSKKNDHLQNEIDRVHDQRLENDNLNKSSSEVPRFLENQDIIKNSNPEVPSCSENDDARNDSNPEVSSLPGKHNVLSPCKDSCRFKCQNHVSFEFRKEINTSFWKLSWMEKKFFISRHVKNNTIKRRKVTSDKFIRNNQYSYHLMSNDNVSEIQVCKLFFLGTLGYSAKNDFIIRSAMKNVDPSTLLPNVTDGRGKNRNCPSKIPHTQIEDHIESYHPTVSHYRRAHAPNRRYLSTELSITEMHKNYNDKYPLQMCSYETYRSIVQKKNISFTKLGHEECEVCEEFNMHNPDHSKENLNLQCSICVDWSTHKKRATESRQKYMDDVEKCELSDAAYFSVDLQKVIMLPRMDEFKVSVFTKRIVAFNESFVPLGSSKSKNKVMAAIWHEGISSRKKEDIISAFHAFFLENRDKKRIILWMDNCCAQNKNWCFLSFLIYIVNSPDVETNFIEINYFEKGHTFMSADSFHHQVEASMKKMGKIYDFPDFESAVSNANSERVTVKSLTPADFLNWKDHSSPAKLKATDRPYLRDIRQIKVKQGCYKVEYNLTYEEKSSLPELDFLKAKCIKNGIPLPETIIKSRGIPSSKKQNIIDKLLPMMPKSRHRFWKNLEVSNVSDLIEDYDNDEN